MASPISQAVQNFLGAYQMRQQQTQNEQAKNLFGQMLTGSQEAGSALATLNPELFLKGQEIFANQQKQQADIAYKESEAQRKMTESQREMMDQQRASYLDWEEDAFERVQEAAPEDRAIVYNQLMKRGRGMFAPEFFQDVPEQFDENMAQYFDALGNKKPGELKAGMYKTITAPNGDVYQQDTSTGELEFLFKGVAPEVQLKAGMEKRLVETQDNARKATSKALEYDSIASDFETAGVTAGAVGSVWEGLKDLTGQQDFESDLRRKWRGIKASQVVNNLPPGAASDKDISMAMAGFPADNASPETVASFLRGMAKVERENAKYNELEAQWIATQGNTAAAKKDFDFNGIGIKKGETLLDSYKKIATEEWGDEAPVETPKATALYKDVPNFGDVTEDDIAETMRANNMTREQVIQAIEQMIGNHNGR